MLSSPSVKLHTTFVDAAEGILPQIEQHWIWQAQLHIIELGIEVVPNGDIQRMTSLRTFTKQE